MNKIANHKAMCGIFGILNKDGSSVDKDLVKSATRKLNHRGPDGEGFFLSVNVGLGHKRLSIIDLSDNASQPFHKHGLSLIHNGEIYNYEEIKGELQELGYEFTSNSDTEVLLSAYDCWGIDAMKKFNGMWAFAIWDSTKKQLLLSRDRYGMKPLYIYETKDFLAFASEIKAFSVLPGWTGELDRENVNDFLSKGQLFHNNRSFYKGVKSLEKSSYLIVNEKGEKIESGSYYKIDNEKNTASNTPENYRTYFSKAVSAHYVADVDVACALSGGLDSSSIVAESADQGKKISTFSYAPSEKKFSEYEYVELLKKEIDFEGHVISPSFEDHIAAHRKALEANEAPCLAINLVTSFLLYKDVADKGFKVLLAGQGADELLLGYSFYYGKYLRHLLKNRPLRFIREAGALVVKYPRQSFRVLGRAMGDKGYGQFLKNGGEDRERIFKDFQSYYEYCIGYGQLYGLLQFEDKLSMAHGVEARLPFLDRDLADYLHAVPFEGKIVNGIRKVPLRKGMKDLLPSRILERKDKLGYLTPEKQWMGEHQEFLKMKIDAGITMYPEWFSPEISGFLDEAFEEEEHYGFLWRVYSFLEFMEVKL